MNDDELISRIESLAGQQVNVLDVGARWGVFDSWSRFSDVLNVVGIDPDPQECERLNMIAPSWVRYHPVAFGETNKSATLWTTQDPACSSLYPPRPELIDHVVELEVTRPVEQSEIELVTADHFYSQNDTPKPHVIKLDTQGSELDILKGATSILGGVELVEIEVEFNEIYEGQPLFGDVDSFLRSQGFELWRLSPLVHYSSHEVASGRGTKASLFFSDVEVSSVDAAGQLFWAQAYYVRKGLGTVGGPIDSVLAHRVAVGAIGLGLWDLARLAVNRAV